MTSYSYDATMMKIIASFDQENEDSQFTKLDYTIQVSILLLFSNTKIFIDMYFDFEAVPIERSRPSSNLGI